MSTKKLAYALKYLKRIVICNKVVSEYWEIIMLDGAEQVVFINNIADAEEYRAKADGHQSRTDALAICTATINRQRAEIIWLKNELAGMTKRALVAESNVAVLSDRSVDLAAVVNATSVTLKEAVSEVDRLSGRQAENDFRIIRTRNYNSEVNRFLTDGSLKTDPRKTDAIIKRKWYVKDLDNGLSA